MLGGRIRLHEFKESSRVRKMTPLLILFEGVQDNVVLLSERSWAEISLI
jgi:hypothetical protein